jgi:hypothetical protein
MLIEASFRLGSKKKIYSKILIFFCLLLEIKKDYFVLNFYYFNNIDLKIKKDIWRMIVEDISNQNFPADYTTY